MRAVDLIRRKRDGVELPSAAIDFLVAGYTRGDIPDYQMAAFLMAAFCRGLSRLELAALTNAMLHSGTVLDLSTLPGAKVDKHSTGGVGDKTSLILAPIVAAAGCIVPMISGRGLGHTGGTLDKLESIPGFNVHLSLDEFRQVLAKCGCALIGQTAEIAPADKKLYALRDATGTVESPFLICASIMSKKLAEGIDALVLDVKSGSGAFMKTQDEARSLARLMVETGEQMGKKIVALITDMNEPLGRSVGNSLEVQECIAILRGEDTSGRLREISLELAAWMLRLAAKAPTHEACLALAEETLASGKALEKFREVIRLQGGDPRVLDDPKRLPQSAHTVILPSPASGFITAVDTEGIGIASALLGGGREKKEDLIDPAVGIVIHRALGSAVQAGEPLCTIHYNSAARLDAARDLLLQSHRIDANDPGDGLRRRPMILEVLGRTVF